MPKLWLQDLFDANQLQSQLDEQASMFINRQVQMLAVFVHACIQHSH